MVRSNRILVAVQASTSEMAEVQLTDNLYPVTEQAYFDGRKGKM